MIPKRSSRVRKLLHGFLLTHQNYEDYIVDHYDHYYYTKSILAAVLVEEQPSSRLIR